MKSKIKPNLKKKRESLVSFDLSQNSVLEFKIHDSPHHVAQSRQKLFKWKNSHVDKLKSILKRKESQDSLQTQHDSKKESVIDQQHPIQVVRDLNRKKSL